MLDRGLDRHEFWRSFQAHAVKSIRHSTANLQSNIVTTDLEELIMKNVLIAAFAALALSPFAQANAATTYKDVYDFCPQVGCTDGAHPAAGLTPDGAGNFYGTASNGGDSNSDGTVFKLSPAGRGLKLTTVYTFCTQMNCTDGKTPNGPPIIDVNGNIYGTATFGGNANNGGVIYELTPKGRSWIFRVLHTFCSLANCTDGGSPAFEKLTYAGAMSGAPYDGTSPLYGTTGVQSVVFSFTPAGRRYKVLYRFCPKAGCADGNTPYSGVILDGNGKLYGTTLVGGATNAGVVYELAPQGTRWVETVLHTFCIQAGCPDGGAPWAAPVMDGAGMLYGTAYQGGANNGGIAWRVIPNGRQSRFSILHDFCVAADCADGKTPFAGLTLDASANLYGLVAGGGANNGGTLFRLSGKNHTTFAVVESLGGASTPGAVCAGDLTLDSAGALFGTCSQGGSTSALSGDVFKLTP
jgi:uncharacterized repeat protein (TIGR03803 family)